MGQAGQAGQAESPGEIPCRVSATQSFTGQAEDRGHKDNEA